MITEIAHGVKFEESACFKVVNRRPLPDDGQHRERRARAPEVWRRLDVPAGRPCFRVWHQARNARGRALRPASKTRFGKFDSCDYNAPFISVCRVVYQVTACLLFTLPYLTAVRCSGRK